MGSGKVDGESLVAGVVPPVVTTRSGEGEAGNGDVSRRDFLQAGALLGTAILAPGCATASGTALRPTCTSERSVPPYDVVIVGGGPGGLAAALTLGRSRKRVLLCDSGPRRNAAAEHIHNFVTRDGARVAAMINVDLAMDSASEGLAEDAQPAGFGVGDTLALPPLLTGNHDAKPTQRFPLT